MINQSTLIMMDFETGSRNPFKTQPIELAAVAINPRTLEIIPDTEFCSLIRPFSEEEAIKLGLDLLEDDALKVNEKNREELAKAPDIKIVWQQFCDYVNNFNYKKRKWDSPICCGFNNNGFDDIITNRICGSDPWNLGPVYKDRGTCSLFHPAINLDLMRLLFPWMESNVDLQSLSMDNLRDYFGMSRDNAHQALQDVKDQAAILCRLMKLTRGFTQKVTFKDCFKIK